MTASNRDYDTPSHFTVVSGPLTAFDLLLGSVDQMAKELNRNSRVMEAGFSELRDLIKNQTQS